MPSRVALERGFLALSLVLVGAVAVLQGALVVRFASARFVSAPPAPLDVPAPADALRPHHRDAVRGDNPFDSSRRDLSPPPSSTAAPTAYASPYLAPPCPGVRVIATAAADDPDRSFALLAGGVGEPLAARVRARGDRYGGREVSFVAFDRAFLGEGPSLCQAEMYGPPPPIASAPPPPPASPAAATRGIRALSPGVYEVERATLDRLREAPQDVFRGVRALPEMVDGRPSGVRLFGVGENSPLAAIGLSSGDRLESLNGLALGDPESLLKAYGALAVVDRFQIEITRQGARRTLEVRIR